MLDAVLLIKIIEHLGSSADVIDQLTARNARLLTRLALMGSIAHRFADVVGHQDQPARLDECDLRRMQGRMLNALAADSAIP